MVRSCARTAPAMRLIFAQPATTRKTMNNQDKIQKLEKGIALISEVLDEMKKERQAIVDRTCVVEGCINHRTLAENKCMFHSTIYAKAFILEDCIIRL